MNRKNWIAAALALAVVIAALGAWLGYARYARREPRMCEVCRRPIMPQTAFSVRVGSRIVWTCCPRCWLHFYGNSKVEMEDPTATDYVSGRRIPAGRCVYVEASDLMPCCSPEVMAAQDDMIMARCYDRCSPSVIAFADAEEALAFTKRHGGKIITFQTLLDEAKNP